MNSTRNRTCGLRLSRFRERLLRFILDLRSTECLYFLSAQLVLDFLELPGRESSRHVRLSGEFERRQVSTVGGMAA